MSYYKLTYKYEQLLLFSLKILCIYIERYNTYGYFTHAKNSFLLNGKA